MRAWQLDNSGTLRRAELATPLATAGEVLIRVHAAGVTPTEVAWYPTTHKKSGDPRSEAIPGHEFSGTVEAIGTGVSGVAIGQDVYGMNDWFADGATADYCITKPDWVSAKPRNLTHAEAATVPIGALTAWQGLFDRAKLQPGETVLIHGGSGAVGVFAIQLAKRHGAKVVTTASLRNEAFLREIGATQVIDYQRERFEDRVKNVDVIFDGVGGNTLSRSWPLLAPAGRLVTIAADSEGTQDERTKDAFFIVEPDQSQLRSVARMLKSGELCAVIDAVVPFTRADTAYAGKIEKRAGRGKVVIAVVE